MHVEPITHIKYKYTCEKHILIYMQTSNKDNVRMIVLSFVYPLVTERGLHVTLCQFFDEEQWGQWHPIGIIIVVIVFCIGVVVVRC